MSEQNYAQSVLIVSAAPKPIEFIRGVLPHGEFSPVFTASNAGQAKRFLLDTQVDIVIINAPLSDEYGNRLALDIVTNYSAGVLILVRPEVYEQVAYKMEQYGILTLTKALDRQTLYQTVKLLSATSNKMRRIEKSSHKLENKLHEMKAISKAKGLLIENENMSEEAAHRYIEKQAMDRCSSRKEIAEGIIKTYS